MLTQVSPRFHPNIFERIGLRPKTSSRSPSFINCWFINLQALGLVGEVFCRYEHGLGKRTFVLGRLWSKVEPMPEFSPPDQLKHREGNSYICRFSTARKDLKWEHVVANKHIYLLTRARIMAVAQRINILERISWVLIYRPRKGGQLNMLTACSSWFQPLVDSKPWKTTLQGSEIKCLRTTRVKHRVCDKGLKPEHSLE